MSDERAGRMPVFVRDGATPRGLDTRPRLRVFATIVWSSFLGASFGMLGVLLMPEGWFDAPIPLGHLARSFAFLCVLAFVAAGSQALLMMPRGARRADLHAR
ncbi:MAG TPA: hypothetical protein VJM11_21395 [Nevskiaceae bacterium]|nr:hypothetical protein [Nevskiaceae bacterium]